MQTLTKLKKDINHFKNFVILVTAVIKNNSQILLLQRSSTSNTFPQLWQLPEGKLELGEQPKKALEREIAEELSCGVDELKFIHAHTTPISVYSKNLYVLRIIAKVKISGAIRLSDEHSQYTWVDKKDLEQYHLVPGTLEAAVLQ